MVLDLDVGGRWRSQDTWERRKLGAQTPAAQRGETVGSGYYLLETVESKGLNSWV